ncbi:MAG: class I mannose-6-phosphate isomerase [Kiritimatiellaeota bacterium]|nr:class I mannose-6-phosphate isomerase [Kiritimatiellota bacterium]
MQSLYPLRFNPVYKDYLWGGSRIPKVFDRDMPDGIYAESWEISTHPDGATTIANGPLAGKTLSDLLPEHKTELLGTHVQGDDFPLLIKLIDARDKLSVQVHPNDGNAAAVDGDPKSELWFFLEGDAGAQIYCGLKPGIGKEEFLQALEGCAANGGNKNFADILQIIPAVKGEAVFVPGGRVHAIGPGCLILEVQQNSNTTYRIYDWDRTDADGNTRDLRIDKALQVIDWENNGDPHCEVRGNTIQSCEYFQLDLYELTEETAFPNLGKSFHALFVAEGKGIIRWTDGEDELVAGQSWFVPAGLGDYEIIPEDGAITVLCTTIP